MTRRNISRRVKVVIPIDYDRAGFPGNWPQINAGQTSSGSCRAAQHLKDLVD
jgi:hypothetical protein